MEQKNSPSPHRWGHPATRQLLHWGQVPTRQQFSEEPVPTDNADWRLRMKFPLREEKRKIYEDGDDFL
jgi:hypothetical protein